jgi:hypothetical protein
VTYFNLVQILESSGIGLIYGLRFYSRGQLDPGTQYESDLQGP